MLDHVEKRPAKSVGCGGWLLLIPALLVFIPTLVFLFSLIGTDPAAECRTAARQQLLSGSGEFVEVTSVSGEQVRGYVGRYGQGGRVERVTTWDCSTEAGEAVVTWQPRVD